MIESAKPPKGFEDDEPSWPGTAHPAPPMTKSRNAILHSLRPSIKNGTEKFDYSLIRQPEAKFSTPHLNLDQLLRLNALPYIQPAQSFNISCSQHKLLHAVSYQTKNSETEPALNQKFQLHEQ
jgi:hypothetical protein